MICDEAFIHAELQRWNDDQGELGSDEGKQITALFNQIKTAMRGFLFEWLLIHEIGHLVHNHSKGDLDRAWIYGNGVAVGTEIEKEADDFYISRLQRDTARQTAAHSALSSLITELYREAALSQHPPDEIERQVAKFGDDFIYRAELDITVVCGVRQHPPCCYVL